MVNTSIATSSTSLVVTNHFCSKNFCFAFLTNPVTVYISVDLDIDTECGLLISVYCGVTAGLVRFLSSTQPEHVDPSISVVQSSTAGISQA